MKVSMIIFRKLKSHKGHVLLLANLLLMLTANPLSTTPLVKLQTDTGKYPLGRAFEILQDPHSNLSIQDLQKKEYSTAWILSQDDTPNFSFSDLAFWLRTIVHNKSDHEREMIFEIRFAILDYIDIYIADELGNVQKQWQTGDRRDFSALPIDHRFFLFPINVESRSDIMIYIRIASHDGLHESLSATLWSRAG